MYHHQGHKLQWFYHLVYLNRKRVLLRWLVDNTKYFKTCDFTCIFGCLTLRIIKNMLAP